MSLASALRSYRQADEDGVMCTVSRQAVDEAADQIERLFDVLAGATVTIAHALSDGEIGERVREEFEDLHKEICDALNPQRDH